MHRLDRDTSGLMAAARTEEAYERLSQLVRERALERTYLALVEGRPRSRRGRIDAPIGRDRHDPTRISLDSDSARDAVTHFEVEQLFDRHALLRVQLETGRMHQIRVHLAAIDLPVVGDPGLRPQRRRLSGASSCTRRSSRSHTRSPVSGSSSSPRSRPTSSPTLR